MMDQFTRFLRLASHYEETVNAWAMKARAKADDRNVAAGKVYEARKAVSLEIARLESTDYSDGWVARWLNDTARDQRT